MDPATPGDAVAAATLIVMRDRADGSPPELLMAERAAGMAFAGGALVFPGGRVDPGDRLLAAASADIEDGAARMAAIRETIEETGVAIALAPEPDPAVVAKLREGLAAGNDFGQLLSAFGLTAEPDRLTSFTRWRPAAIGARRFDTRFYVARAPAGAMPSPDGAETAAAFWMSATDVIAAGARGEARIIYPTRRNLERLARFGSFAEAVTDAANHPVVTITPHVEQRDGEAWLCIPEGLGYPVTAERLAGMTRG